MAPIMIAGHVAPGFEAVRHAFERNFVERGEVGAACAVYVGGEAVVDLWGGLRDADRGEPWEADTLVMAFSLTKGLAAMVVALAHSRGRLDYDAPVAEYWPEFAAAGKSKITVRQLLGHEAGLPAVDEPLTFDLLNDLDALADVLARQRPAWPPGQRHGYHALTLGLYQNEIIRRTDPQRRTIGQILREDIAEKLGTEMYVGLPISVREERLAVLSSGSKSEMLRSLDTLSPKFVLASMFPGNITYRTFRNPKLRSATELAKQPWLGIELPSANGVVEIRGVANAYSAFAVGDKKLGLDRSTLSALETFPDYPESGRKDAVLRTNTIFSHGFWKPYRGYPFGSDSRAYGCPGAGGSIGFADPRTGMGFAYAPNRLGMHMWNDPREAALRDATYRCLIGTSVD